MTRAQGAQKIWEKEHPLRARLVVQPDSPRRARWDVLMVAVVVVNVVVVPLDIGFEIASYSWPFLSFLLLSDLLFLLDLVLGFFIAFTSKANELVTQARDARRPPAAARRRPTPVLQLG